jgi:hypothetical protein
MRLPLRVEPRPDCPEPVAPGGDQLGIPRAENLVPDEDQEPVLLRLEEGDLVEV